MTPQTLVANIAAQNLMANRQKRKQAALSDTKFQSTKRWFLFGLSVLGVGTLAGLLTRKYFLKIRAERRSKTGLEQTQPSGIARMIRTALKGATGWGLTTDENALRLAVSRVKSIQSWHKVIDSYRVQYQRNLVRDLESGLSSRELEEIRLMVSSKPQTDREADQNGMTVTTAQAKAWAKRIRNAFENGFLGSSWGKDLEAIFQITREVPTKTGFARTLAAYEALFGEPLIKRLRAELSESEARHLLEIYHRKPA